MTDLHLQALDEITSDYFGGKAAGLARLCHSGLPVPEGFAVSATVQDPSRWPEAVRADYLRRCRGLLSGGRIAVRSSALGEDAPDHSYAGLFQSVLDIATEQDALAAAATCIASGAADRVLAYARRTEPVPVGLVVQRMVEARTAGVVFSRDPSGKDPAIVVEAVAGLGDRLVSGSVTPETWRVYRTGLGDLDPRRSGQAQVLDERRACDIAMTARRTADRWGTDLDMEWAIDEDDRLWWVQARPITTGAPWRPPVVSRSSVGADDGPVSVWSNMNLRESMPDPLHPLSWSVWKDTLVPIITEAMVHIPPGSPAFTRASGIDLVNGRLYINLNAFFGAPPFGSLALRLPNPLDEGTGTVVRDLARRGVLRARRNPGAWRAMLGGALSGLLPKDSGLPKRSDAGAWLTALATCAEGIRKRTPIGDLPDEALLGEIMLLAQPEMTVLRKGLGVANTMMFTWLIAQRLFRPWPEAARRLGAGVVGNPTTDISLGIDELVGKARPFADRFTTSARGGEVLADLRAAAPAEPQIRAWLGALEGFLARFGHRTAREFDLATPRWVDDPALVIELVRAGVLVEGGESLAVRMARLRRERAEAVEAAIRAAPVWRRGPMRWAERNVLAWMPMREAPKHYLMSAFLRSRHAALEVGRRLRDRGVLAVAEDVFFLDFAELDGIVLRGEPLPVDLDARRRDFDRWMRTPPDDVIRSDGVPVDVVAMPIDPDVLVGHGIGGGVGEGPVTILEEPDPRLMRDGDVLVVTFADPGWTPLFPRASAIVMEVGGTMCHAAVVARELGIPAVFAVRDAKTRLTAGERVRVDGDSGRVVRLTGGN
jgi:rifampicin phosphotransferase